LLSAFLYWFYGLDERTAHDLKKLFIYYLTGNHPDLNYRNVIEAVDKDDADAVEAFIIKKREIPVSKALQHASARGKLKVLAILIDRGFGVNTPFNGWPPLSSAAIEGQYDAAKLLIENGAKVDFKNSSGNTPLMIAAGRGFDRLVKLFISAGADLNCKNKSGLAAVHFVAQNKVKEFAFSRDKSSYSDEESGKYYKVMTALLSAGANPNLYSKDGWTPVFFAISARDPEMVKILIRGGAKVKVKEPRYGGTPLHLAVAYRDYESAEVLIKNGANINAQAKDGRTPLHCAAVIYDKKMMELLIKNRADPEIKDKYGKKPNDYLNR